MDRPTDCAALQRRRPQPKHSARRSVGCRSRHGGTCDAAIGMHCGASGQCAAAPRPQELNAKHGSPCWPSSGFWQASFY
jgi:hypothetical protein